MKVAEFHSVSGQRIGIPIDQITGFIEVEQKNKSIGSCFIATGADSVEGGENGWYVAELYEEVIIIFQDIEGDYSGRF